MKYPLSELIDRYSILLLKSERLPKDTVLEDQLIVFLDAIASYDFYSIPYIEEMKAINGRIWDLEAAIRQGQKLSMAEVGRRALAIRDINKERIALKNKIAAQLGEFEDIKVDHRSA